MKISITIETSPEEIRETLGLPDVQAFQKTIMEALKNQVTEGHMDPSFLLDNLAPKSLKWGKAFWDLVMNNLDIVTSNPTSTDQGKKPSS